MTNISTSLSDLKKVKDRKDRIKKKCKTCSDVGWVSVGMKETNGNLVQKTAYCPDCSGREGDYQSGKESDVEKSPYQKMLFDVVDIVRHDKKIMTINGDDISKEMALWVYLIRVFGKNQCGKYSFEKVRDWCKEYGCEKVLSNILNLHSWHLNLIAKGGDGLYSPLNLLAKKLKEDNERSI